MSRASPEMQAVLWHGRDDVRVESIGHPRLLDDADVVVAVTAAGICGTDIEEWLHGPIAVTTRPRQDPSRGSVVLGHEFVGRVVEAGAAAEVRLGALVAVEVNITCQTCGACRRGDTQLCPETTALGLQDDGGLAEYVRVPSRLCVTVAEHIGSEVAVLAEPLAVALHALRLSPTAANPIRSVVFGGGAVGQLIARAAYARGDTVVLVEPVEQRRALAEKSGVQVATIDQVTDRFQSLGWLDGADIAYDASGNTQAISAAMDIIRPGGTLMLLGVNTGSFPATPWQLLRHELQVRGSMSHTIDDFRDAVGMLESGAIDAGGLVTHTFPLGDAIAAFDLVARSPDDVLKCIVTTPAS